MAKNKIRNFFLQAAQSIIRGHINSYQQWVAISVSDFNSLIGEEW